MYIHAPIRACGKKRSIFKPKQISDEKDIPAVFPAINCVLPFAQGYQKTAGTRSANALLSVAQARDGGGFAFRHGGEPAERISWPASKYFCVKECIGCVLTSTGKNTRPHS